MSMIEDFLNLMKMGPGEPLAHDEVGGLIVSTVVTTDLGPETALLDLKQTIPVERYANRAAALEGHAKWLAWAADRSHTAVIKLGYGVTVAPEMVMLQRGAVHADS